jgi:hypothetical protein
MLMNSTLPDKEYYRKLYRRARFFRVDLANKKWCDLWHDHFDWNGFGNRSLLHRRKHLAILFQAFHRAQIELASQTTPYQIFINISRRDSGSDALYVHTPNPNSTKFPIDFSKYKLLTKAPSLLAGRFDLNNYSIYTESDKKDTWYMVVPKKINPPSTFEPNNNLI